MDRTWSASRGEKRRSASSCASGIGRTRSMSTPTRGPRATATTARPSECEALNVTSSQASISGRPFLDVRKRTPTGATSR